MDRDFEPDWRVIDESDFWRETIVPWMESVRDDYREKAERSTDLGTCRELVVAARTISTLLTMPKTMIELERQMREQENKDAERPSRGNRDWRSY